MAEYTEADLDYKAEYERLKAENEKLMVQGQ